MRVEPAALAPHHTATSGGARRAPDLVRRHFSAEARDVLWMSMPTVVPPRGDYSSDGDSWDCVANRSDCVHAAASASCMASLAAASRNCTRAKRNNSRRNCIG